MLFQGTECFHQCAFKIITDAHNLAGCFHLRRQSTFCRNKFVERKSRNLYDTIIQSGFKACICFACNRVFDLIQRITKRDLGRDFSNRVTRCLGSQSRRTAHTRIYFNHAVFETGRMQGKLYVAASRNLQLIDDVKRRAAEHLIFFITERLRRRYYDAVSRMYAHRIDILHITYGNTIACAIAHNFILDFLPAGNTAFHQNLSHPGKTQAVGKDLLKLGLIIGNSAAGTAKGVSRT